MTTIYNVEENYSYIDWGNYTVVAENLKIVYDENKNDNLIINNTNNFLQVFKTNNNNFKKLSLPPKSNSPKNNNEETKKKCTSCLILNDNYSNVEKSFENKKKNTSEMFSNISSEVVYEKNLKSINSVDPLNDAYYQSNLHYIDDENSNSIEKKENFSKIKSSKNFGSNKAESIKNDVISTTNLSKTIDDQGNKRINDYLIIKNLGK